MAGQTALTLVNPQNGNLAFKVFSFDNNNYFDHLQRNNFYSWSGATGRRKIKSRLFLSMHSLKILYLLFHRINRLCFQQKANFFGVCYLFSP